MTTVGCCGLLIVAAACYVLGLSWVVEHAYNFVAYDFGWHEMSFPVALVVVFLVSLIGSFFKSTGSSK